MFASRLKKLQSTWDESKERAREMFTKVPPGVYLTQVQLLELGENSNGLLQVKREHLVLDGEHKGVTIYDTLQLETSDLSMAFFRREVEAYDYEPPADIADIEGTINEIVEEAPQVKLRVTHSKAGYLNAAVIEGLEGAEAAAEGAEAVEEEAGDEAGDEYYTAEEILAIPKRVDLKELIKDNDLETNPDDYKKLSKLKQAIIKELGLDETEEEEQEEEEAGTEPGEEEPSELVIRAQAFCGTQDLAPEEGAIEDITDIKVLTALIDGFEYPEDELTEDEISLLGELDMDGNIKRATKKKKIAKKPGK